jgi:hypothetical protein
MKIPFNCSLKKMEIWFFLLISLVAIPRMNLINSFKNLQWKLIGFLRFHQYLLSIKFPFLEFTNHHRQKLNFSNYSKNTIATMKCFFTFFLNFKNFYRRHQKMKESKKNKIVKLIKQLTNHIF